MPEESSFEQSIFFAAVEKPGAAERAAYLDEACRGNAELRSEVEALLAAHERLPPPDSSHTADLDPPPMFTAPGTVIGHYKLLEPIGEGGYGTVFMAEQTAPVQRRVALKVIKAGMDTRQVIARFEAERQVLALMDHPHIARVFDAGVTETGRPYFVMELVKGLPITRYCDEHRLTPRQRLELFVQVCQAVQHAHQKGIIHRDLKPTNVLVAQYDGKPVPKVIDFGVAKATGQRLTEATMFTGFGDVIGTPQYMSPEQAELNQLDVDTRSDIYSLGVLLYELLTGTTPLESRRVKEAALLEVLRVIREEEPPRPSTRLTATEQLGSIAAQRGLEPKELSGIVKGDLDWIVMKALEKDRGRRYETVSGFAADVERYLADEPVMACPPSATYRLRKFARRNKAALAVAALVLFFLGLLGTTIGWSMRERVARQARVSGQVELILAEVDRLEREQKWPDALAAARRAEAVVTGGGADAATERRVRASIQGLELLERLEGVRMLTVTSFKSPRDRPNTDTEYRRAFREYGVDVDELPAEASIERLGARAGLTVPLAASLDHWARYRRRDPEKYAASWNRLVAVARGIDPEPLRDRIRSTWGQPVGQVRDDLRRLAASIDAGAHPPDTMLALADTLQEVGLQDDALRILRDHRQARPDNFHANSSLAGALREDHEGAVRFANAAVAIRPRSALAHHNLGFYLKRHGKLSEAALAFRAAIAIDPHFVNTHEGLAETLLAEGKPQEALDACRNAITIDSDRHEYQRMLGRVRLALGKPDEANAAYENALGLLRTDLALDPNNAAYYHFQIGNVLLEQGNADAAIEAWRTTIKLDPNAVYTGIQLAWTLERRGRLDEAIDAYRQAIDVYPDKVSPYRHNLASLLRLRGRRDQAIAVYRKALEVNASDAHAHVGLGVIFADQKMWEKAIDLYRKALDIDPKLAVAHHNMGEALREVNRIDEAIRSYESAIALNEKFGHPHVGLGEIYYGQGKLGEAIAAFTKGVELQTPHTNEVADVLRYVERMKEGEDFALVRDREDFKRLVAAVDAKRRRPPATLPANPPTSRASPP